MREKQRQGEPGDLVQVPLFDSGPRGGLSRGPLQHKAERQQWGFLKEKAWGLWGGRGGVSLLFFQAGASGFQAVSWDNRSGKGPACSQVQEGQSGHRLSWLAPGVCCVCGGREFQWSRRLLSELGQLSHRQSRGLECGLTGSLAVWGVGNWPGPFNHEEGLLGHKAVLVLTF